MSAGRPTAAETQARTREFVRRVVAGEPWDEAAAAARVKPARALRLVQDLVACGALTMNAASRASLLYELSLATGVRAA